MSDDPMLRITAIKARPVIVPMRLPLHTANGAIDKAALVLIDLQTSGGIVGRSYLFAIGAHNLRPIVALLEAMAQMLEGDLLAPFEIERKLRKRYALLGVHNIVLFALSGIDMAAWDARAQAGGVPLVTLLGGAPRPVRAYNSCGLGIMPVKALARQARALLKEGFSAVKLRLGREDANADLEAVRVVKDAIGPEVTLMCDFNQGLTVNEAIRRGQMLDDEGGLLWIEEPVRADDFEGNARVADAVVTPISLGENFMGPEQMATAINFGCCDFVMPDVQRIAGVSGWMRAAALAEAASLDMSSHLFPEIGSHLMAVTPTATGSGCRLGQPGVASRCRSGRSCADCRYAGHRVAWDEKAVSRYAAWEPAP
ncbi:MAG: enolase C-terminal domain-like protein [Burkholderiaceae bacterium]